MLEASSANAQGALGEAFSKMRHVRMDGRVYIAVTDLFSGLSGKTTKAVAETLKLPHIASKPEVVRLTARQYKFPGRGQKEVPVVTQEEALELKDHLPLSYSGDLNAYMRKQFMRVNAGDQTLHSELDRNAVSGGVVHESARECLGIADAGVIEAAVVDMDPADHLIKRRKLLADIDAQEAATQQLRLQTAERTQRLLEGFAVSSHLDARDKQILQDFTLNSLLCGRAGQALLSNCDTDEEELTVSAVVSGLGLRFDGGDLAAIGRRAAAKYREKYHAEPRVVRRLVNKTEQDVKWYTRRDADLLEEAVREHFEAKQRERAPGQRSIQSYVAK